MAENERTFWNKFWAEEDFLNPKAHGSLVFASEMVLRGFPGRRTLEVGAGRGVDSIEMARRGALCWLVDCSKTSFAISSNLARASGVKVMPCQAGAEQLPFTKNHFDLVFSQGLMEHPGLMGKLLPEQIRVTRPGGFVLIDVPQLFSIQAMVKWVELQLGRWPFGPEVNFTEGRLKKIISSAGLEYVFSYGREFIPMVRLGIRTALAKVRHRDFSLKPEDLPLESLPADGNLITDLELGFFGPKLLNNVGIIAQKPKA